MTLFQRFFYSLLLFFIAILSVSGTIAMRNVVHVVLLGMFIWALLNIENRCVIKPAELWRKVPWVLRFWIGFLILFPFWAVDKDVALQQLIFHWSESILTWVLAFAAVVILGKKNISLWSMTWASSLPILIHLVLIPFTITGIFREGFGPEEGLITIWNTFKVIIFNHSALEIKYTPVLGFKGIEPMHGNIGYASSQTIVLALACYLQKNNNNNKNEYFRNNYAAIFIVGLCLTSALISSSRGTFFASITIIFAAVILYLYSNIKNNKNPHDSKKTLINIKEIFLWILILIIVLTLLASLFQRDQRWGQMIDKFQYALSIDNPVKFICDGPQEQDLENLNIIFPNKNAQYKQDIINSLMHQDGGRLILQKIGVELISENIIGLDGSRQSYIKLIEKKCSHTPMVTFAHAHSGWINLALSIGLIGAAIYAWVLFYFLFNGSKNLIYSKSLSPYSFALFLISFFWIMRGFVDAVFQEHTLQMQAIIILIIYFKSIDKKES